MKNIFNLAVQYPEKFSGIVQQLQAGAGIEWTGRKSSRLEKERRWEMVELKDHQQQRWRTSYNFTHVQRWWNTYLHLWKFTAWRFIYRGLTVFRSSIQFLIEVFGFLILGCMSCLFILDINPLSVSTFANISPPLCGFSFNFVDGFLCCPKPFKFD